MANLLNLQFALDQNDQLISLANARKGEYYSCPACRSAVIYRHGKIRVAHFAHKALSGCSQETITHKTAKLLIQKVIIEWKSGNGQPPRIERRCQGCGKCVPQPLPEKVEKALLEHRLNNGYVVDLALMVEGKPQAAIEIRVTHNVGEIKAENLSIPFIEVDGNEVIQRPMVWRPIVDKFILLLCNDCKSLKAKFEIEAKQIANACNIELPTFYYRYGICKCWNCKRKIIVFTWVKEGIHDNSAPKLKPIPQTIQYKYSKTVGHHYWLNTCPYCHVIQGDYFLYCEPDGPFFGVTCTEDTEAAFLNDMLAISLHS